MQFFQRCRLAVLVEGAVEAEAVGAADEFVKVGDEVVAQRLPDVGRADGGGVLPHQVVKLCLRQRGDDLFFVVKMPVDSAAGHFGLARDGAQRGLGVALFVKEDEGGFQDVVSGLFGFSFGSARDS